MKRQTHSVKTFLSILGGSLLAGWFLSVLNIGGAAIGRGSIFRLSDLPVISLWHMMIWGMGGLGLAIAVIVARWIRHKPPPNRHSGTALLFLFGAFWFYCFGQVNIRFLTGFTSPRSLLWNGLLFGGGAALLIIFARITKKIPSRLSRFFLASAVLLMAAVTFLSVVLPLLNSSENRMDISGRTNRQGDRINVLFILLDAVRADHLSCYGYQRRTTPSIDRMAAEGILFEEAFSQSSHTLESVASYMTSTYPSTHGVRTQTAALPRRLRTLPDLFHDDGYATAVFSANPYVSAVYGYGKGVDDFYWPEGNKVKINKTILGHVLQSFKSIDLFKKPAAALLNLGLLFYSKKNAIEGSDPRTITTNALEWMKQHRDRPFFLYLHYDGGHNPYISPDPALFDPDYSGTPVINFPEGLGLFYPDVKGRPLPKDQKQNLIAQYDGQIHYHDSQLGRLFEHLKTAGLDTNTVVIITSDHGEEFYEHEGWGHGQSLFDEVIHVPLVLRLPGILPEKIRFPHQVELTDIAPTLLQLCSVRSFRDLDYPLEGKSLLLSLKNPASLAPRSAIFSELLQGGHSASCLRSPILKTMRINMEGHVLHLAFDLTRDKYEQSPLDLEENETAAQQFIQLEKMEATAQKRAFRGTTTRLDEKQKEQLRSLGYIK